MVASECEFWCCWCRLRDAQEPSLVCPWCQHPVFLRRRHLVPSRNIQFNSILSFLSIYSTWFITLRSPILSTSFYVYACHSECHRPDDRPMLYKHSPRSFPYYSPHPYTGELGIFIAAHAFRARREVRCLIYLKILWLYVYCIGLIVRCCSPFVRSFAVSLCCWNMKLRNKNPLKKSNTILS